MIYIKGLLAGTLTLVVSIVLYVVVWIWYASRAYADRVPPGGSIGIDLSSLLYSPVFWLVAVVGFACGFAWACRSPA